MTDLSALSLPIWTFVALASLSASIGAMLAAQFDAVKVHPNIYVLATGTPAILALILVQAPVPLTFALWSAVLILVLSGLTVMDAMTCTVPDVLTLPLILLGVLHAQMSGASGMVFAGAAMSVIAIAVAARCLFRCGDGWVGDGDVLLFAAAVAWFGPAMLPDILFLTGIILFVRLCLGRVIDLGPATCIPIPQKFDHAIPLAPSLGAAQLLIWMGGPFF
ncbi:MAG: A24 family peptidase [Albidovulum sp.]|uniref:prepilin peptidase n=1 Tax=Albidovulum sp. TaxID=1872424 RepID=UPI003C85958E